MKYAIIVAGGKGKRMNSEVPKQFLLLNHIPVMMHAINAFHTSKSGPTIVVALHPETQGHWLNLCQKYHFHVPHIIADGGESRFESVKNSLEAVKQMNQGAKSLIAIHDAVRPFVDPAMIDESFDRASTAGAAVVAIQSSNSIRIKSEDGLKSHSVRRELVYVVQTPQTFRSSILYDAYDQSELPEFTDDASVVEKKGYPITIMDGDTRNIKITYPEDLDIAQLLLANCAVRRRS